MTDHHHRRLAVIVPMILGLLFATPELADALHAQPASPQVERLEADLRRIVNEPGWRNARYGVMVTSMDHGDTLFTVNPDAPIAPASVMKLFTTAAALYYLGADFRYSTYLLADGEVNGDVLEGDVILYGTGNPGIATRTMGSATSAAHALADELEALGVRTVTGDVVGDGSYFDNVWLGSGWNAENLLAWYSAPVGALSHGENMVSVRVHPGGGNGQPARVSTNPGTIGLALENRVRTSTGGNTSVRFFHENGSLVVDGQITTTHPGVSRQTTVVDPANYAAATLRAALEGRGIEVRGDVRSVPDRDDSRVTFASGNASRNGAPAVLAVHRSPALTEMVAATNMRSHNLYAEALLKTLGRVVFGEGSFRAGEQAVKYFLECETNLDPEILRIVDGSGLSRLNRVTPRATVHLLDYMARDSDWEVFRASLSVASVDMRPHRGTLRNRMGLSSAAGNLRAKTGTISRVSALAGYVQSANGERLAFTIFGNDVPSTWRMKRIEDGIGIRLAEFSRSPPEPETSTPAPNQREPEEEPAAPEEEAEPPPETAPEPEFREHTVQSGEVLGVIAGRYGVTVRELEAANPGLDARRLQLGQTVRVPASPDTPDEPEAAVSRSHTVGAGDTMDAIARRYGVTVRALQDANPGVNPRRIRPGQTLNVPE